MNPVRPNRERFPEIKIETKFSETIRKSVEQTEKIFRAPRIKYNFAENGEWVNIKIK